MNQNAKTSTAEARSHRIRSIRVVGGFLDGLKIDLLSGLNCIIGGRGAGKTTVLEFVRFALNRLPSRENATDVKKRLDTLIARNLGSGRVEVEFETREGLVYRASRTEDEETVILDGSGAPCALTPQADFFKVNIFSQKEVEGVADDALAQLALLDNFATVEIKDLDDQIRQTLLSLKANARKIAPFRTAIANLADELVALQSVREKLKALASGTGDDAQAFNKAHAAKALRDREALALGNIQRFTRDYQTELSRQAGRLARQTTAEFGREVLDGPNGVILKRAVEMLAACGRNVDALLKQAQDRLGTELTALGNASVELKKCHTQQEIAFRELLEKHTQVEGETAERTRLERFHNDLLVKERQHIDACTQRDVLLTERTALLQSLSDLRDRRFQRRKTVAQHITASLNPYIRVSVAQYGNIDPYRKLLADAMNRAKAPVRVPTVSQKIVQAMLPADLATALERKEATTFVERAGLSADQADKVIAALIDPDLLMEIETVELLDLPCIELQDGQQYKATDALSTGQKCTAILPILLLQSEGPLLVDQPEDNLDNRFISETILENLKREKKRRQLVFITHNPNIPVLGDAERVFVMESDGARARLVKSGTVNDCKNEVVELLEGGETAFKERKARYGY